MDRGLDKLISLEYFDENVQGDLDKGFLCYTPQLEYGLSLPLSNLVKGIMNIIGACPAQLNRNMLEIINICESLNRLWEEKEVERKISPEDVLQFYGVKSYSASRAALVNGKQFHGMVIKHGFGMYRLIGNATLDMYPKRGCMDGASLCFGNIVSKNVISWTSLIIGFCKNRLGDEALKAFGQMEMEGVIPNKIIFLGVLYACSHAGLVQEGLKHFNIMINNYCFTTMMEHYTCMVDLLARSGYLEQILEFIEKKNFSQTRCKAPYNSS
ncbi:hypothetical protein GIB67_009438 [Kingdonia uniflora]|uniref:Pentatricopeptide repeat-containing protein n=1 Tax=Kingdonia uniflora TaxID=39325 RepID=A0A7J7N2Y7_9MAGN|nr:hypothetical protein GIB67_009438 [Kingdonia uniflora]